MSNKKIMIGLRFTEEEYAPFEKVILKTGLSKSEFFRLLLTNRLNEKIKVPAENKKIDKLLFYFNKASNNLNQVAKVLNTAHLKGEVNQATLQHCISLLVKMNDSFKYGLYLSDTKN